MSNVPFRELFIELPRALFESLQAIGEAAVDQARARPSAPSTAWKPPWYRTDWVWRRLAQRWGVSDVAINRCSSDLSVEIVFRRRCGHGGRGVIDERALVLAAADAIDALDRAYDSAERECYCMEPAP